MRNPHQQRVVPWVEERRNEAMELGCLQLPATPLFRFGIERVEQRARKHRIALMCAEKEPLDCHRTLLVSRALERGHVAVTQILADGALELQGDALRRLLKLESAGLGDMFDTEETLIELAVQRRAWQVAYQDLRMVQGGAEVVPELTGNVNHI